MSTVEKYVPISCGLIAVRELQSLGLLVDAINVLGRVSDYHFPYLSLVTAAASRMVAFQAQVTRSNGLGAPFAIALQNID